METAWYTASNAAEIPSPALLVYPDRVEENIRRMIRVAGGVERLRPHMKTNKLPEVIRMQMDQGITKFKCATIAEAEMVATCLAPDVLLAYQPVGPNVERFIRLVQTFPKTTFSALVDDEGTIRSLSNAAVQAGLTLNLFLDLDCGMHRSGVPPGPRAAELYRSITSFTWSRAGGPAHVRRPHPRHRSRGPNAGMRRGVRTIPDDARGPCHGGIAGAGVGYRWHADVPSSRAAHRCGMQSGDGGVLGLGIQHHASRHGFPSGHPRCSRAWSASLERTCSVWTSATKPWRRKCRLLECSCWGSRTPGPSAIARSTWFSKPIGPQSSPSARASTASRGTCALPSPSTTKPSL